MRKRWTAAGMLVGEIPDIEAFQEVMKSQAAADAMKHDGVNPETLLMFSEAQQRTPPPPSVASQIRQRGGGTGHPVSACCSAWGVVVSAELTPPPVGGVVGRDRRDTVGVVLHEQLYAHRMTAFLPTATWDRHLRGTSHANRRAGKHVRHRAPYRIEPTTGAEDPVDRVLRAPISADRCADGARRRYWLAMDRNGDRGGVRSPGCEGRPATGVSCVARRCSSNCRGPETTLWSLSALPRGAARRSWCARGSRTAGSLSARRGSGSSRASETRSTSGSR